MYKIKTNCAFWRAMASISAVRPALWTFRGSVRPMGLSGIRDMVSIVLPLRARERSPRQSGNKQVFGFPFSLSASMSQMESTASAIKRTVPVWSLLLVGVLVLGSVVGAFMADPQLATALSSKPTPRPGDFILSSSQASLNIGQGSSGTATLTVTSINSYNNITWLSVALPSNATNALTASLNPGIVTPPAKGGANSTLTVVASSNAPTGNYQITVTGTSGPKTHSIQLTLTVLAGPGLPLPANSSFFYITRGGGNNNTKTNTRFYWFTRKVNMSGVLPFFLFCVGG